MVKRFIIIVLMCVLVASQCFSVERTLKGVIVDAVTQQAIPYANVLNKATGLGTASNADGVFNITLQTGKIELEITHNSYSKIVRQISFLADTTIFIQMQQIEISLDSVTVYGRYFKRLLKDSPRQIHIIDGEDIRKSGSNDMKDVMQNLIPGLDISYSNFIPLATYNGMQAKYLLFLVDGQRMAGESFGNIDYYRLSPDNIERIEVSEGADGALFGSNAVAGVINIITKTQTKGTSANAHLLYSTYNTMSAGSNFFYPISKKLRGSSTIEYTNTSGYEVFDSIGKKVLNVEQSPMKTATINQNVTWNITQKLSASGSISGYYRYRADRSIKHLQYAFVDGNIQAALNYSSTKYSNRLTINADQYRGYEYFTDTKNNRQYYQNNIVNVRDVLKYSFCSGSDIVFGMEYFFDEAFSDRTSTRWANNHSGALFTQIDMKLLSKLFATTSLRYSANNMFGSSFTPDFSLLYKLNYFNFRANIARGFRPPTFKELYFNFDHFGWFYIVGNPDLKPETSVFGSLSTEFHKGVNCLSLTVSENRISDMILEKPVDNSYVYQNISSAVLKTAIFSGRTAFGKTVDIWGDITLVDGKDLTQNNTTLMGVYPWSARLNVSVKFKVMKSDFSWLLSGRAYSETTKLSFNNLTTIQSPAYQMYRTALTFTKSNLTLSSGIDNLLNYTDYYKQSTYSPGRTFFIKLNYNFKNR